MLLKIEINNKTLALPDLIFCEFSQIKSTIESNKRGGQGKVKSTEKDITEVILSLTFIVRSVRIAALHYTKLILEYALQMLQFYTTNLSIIFWMLLERFFHRFIGNMTKE